VDCAFLNTWRVAALKGPTGMGIARLASAPPTVKVGECEHDTFAVELHATADEFTADLVKGDVPIALLPVNAAAVLHAKTEGQVQLAAINTLGVLYVVSKGVAVSSLADLAGKTVYSTGKGTTPEYVFNYLLSAAGVSDVTVEYLSAATEVAARVAAADSVVAVLPEPYVTTVTATDSHVSVALDLTAEWEKVSPSSQLVTGALVVRKDWAEQYPTVFAAFLESYEASIVFANDNKAAAAEEIAALGIVPSAEVAERAIPRAHMVYLAGDAAQSAATGYLQVLFAADPASVGGALPGDDFYWKP
jgi:NitT/TauT family transport system substrate-binding protein